MKKVVAFLHSPSYNELSLGPLRLKGLGFAGSNAESIQPLAPGTLLPLNADRGF